MQAEKPITVYLRWPERDLLALAPLVKLVWSSLISELIHTYDHAEEGTCRPVLFHLDEAARIALPSLDDYAATVVGRHISLLISIQSFSQLAAIYGRDRAEVIRDNCDTQVYYRPSNQVTAEYLERCLGKKSEWASFKTMHEGTETSQGSSEYGVPLMTAQEIKQMGDEEILAFHSNLPPFQARRMNWLNYPLLKARQGKTPPPVSALPEIVRKLLNIATQTSRSSTLAFVNPDVVAAA